MSLDLASTFHDQRAKTETAGPKKSHSFPQWLILDQVTSFAVHCSKDFFPYYNGNCLDKVETSKLFETTHTHSYSNSK